MSDRPDWCECSECGWPTLGPLTKPRDFKCKECLWWDNYDREEQEREKLLVGLRYY